MGQRAVSMSFGVRAFVAALALAALLIVAPGAAQALPGKFWGVVPQDNVSLERFERLKRGGVDSVRLPIFWGNVQPVRSGAFDWSSADNSIATATAAGLEVLPFLYGAPSWAVPSAPVPGSGGTVRAPKFLPVNSGVQRLGWQRFASEAAARYGPGGSFWAANPAIAPRPLRTWQIWNEPNFKFFVVRPNPKEYGQLVKMSYTALRSVDPGAKLVLGGLFARPLEATFKRRPPQAYFAADFLNRMYLATPGIKRRFHGVALHPYTGSYRNFTPYIEEFRDVLQAHRDSGKGLWLTEVSWSSEAPQPRNSFNKGRAGQAKQLKGAFGLVRANQRKWRVQRVYWFSVEDKRNSCNFCGGAGLFTEAFAPKPAWRAFVGFAGGRP
ncbi:MAG TPA: glycosyl hydrolase [Solirubrobacterales bacterium]|nr:glycosyl hydrolase [Solirubrobacterales bacterium]